MLDKFSRAHQNTLRNNSLTNVLENIKNHIKTTSFSLICINFQQTFKLKIKNFPLKPSSLSPKYFSSFLSNPNSSISDNFSRRT